MERYNKNMERGWVNSQLEESIWIQEERINMKQKTKEEYSIGAEDTTEKDKRW